MKRIILLVPLALLLSFSSCLNAQSLNRAEYFYDTDPGVGNGTPVTISTPSDSENLSLNLPVGVLGSGWHYLFFRFRDSLGIWGEYTGQSFLVANSTIDTGSSPKINAAEYFYDSDPGVGNALPLTVSTASDSVNILQNIPVGPLAGGFHYLFVRFRYTNGVWGNYSTQSFYVSPGTIDTGANTSPKINNAEYFIDTDPGAGAGTAVTISTPSDSENIGFNAGTNGLSAGFHYLYTRFGYSNGVWGMPTRESFYVIPASAIDTPSPPINYAEYFFDTDPGVGNGTAVPVSPTSDSVNIIVNVSTLGLTSGNHVLFFRFRYTNGVWGLYQPENDTVTICNPPPATITAAGATNFCQGGSVSLHSDTASVYHYQWQRNGVNLTGDTLSSLVINDSSGTYNVVVTDSGCPGTSNNIVVSIGQSSSYSFNKSICQGQSYFFNGANRTTTGVYHDTLLNVAGCDSFVTLNLNVTSSIQVALTGAICPGDSFAFNNHYYSLAGTYRDTTISSGGCDSITTLTLGLYPVSTTPQAGQICQGDSFYFEGHYYHNGGNYADTLSSVHGCDSIITLSLVVNNPVTDSVSAQICQGSSYLFHDNNLTAAGVYTGIFTNVNGCDSTVILTLSVLSQINDSISASICQGSSYPFNGNNLTTAGVYYDSLQAVGGCDSIVTLTLTVDTLPVVTWTGGPDTVYATSTLYTLTGGNPAGGVYSGPGVRGNNFYPDSTAGPGSYTLTYTYTDGNLCSDSATKTYVVIVSGITEIDWQNSVILYPNPASDMVTAQSGWFSLYEVSPVVYDLTGQLVTTVGFTRHADKMNFNTLALAAGTYYIKFNINGNEVVKKFVKLD